MRRFLGLVLLAACAPAKPLPPGYLTPEQLLAHPPAGAVTVRGKVFTVTFENAPDANRPQPDRWVLIRTTDAPAGATLDNPDPGVGLAAWSLGLHLTADQLASGVFVLPELGDTVEATGTFIQGSWNGTTRPMLDHLTMLSVVHGQPALAGPGEPCALDADCREDLICGRSTHSCTALATPMAWGDAWHDVNGACDTDADCPLGEVCDSGYAMQSSGDFAPDYRHDEDAGRHLCAVPLDATRASVCPRPASSADLAGGRWVTGREVCVEGTLFLQVHAPDGDTHDQLAVEEPLVFPRADAPYYAWGAVTENSPPYKDPTRPGGALGDPVVGQHVFVLGTYRYDETHGWFEVHPIKKWWPAAP